MADLFDNPMGLDGFEFVEFASPDPGVLQPVFEALGFTAIARHRSKNVTLFRQNRSASARSAAVARPPASQNVIVLAKIISAASVSASTPIASSAA
jgi:4-hydroxyphenylpyruvate dioxygenase-like putative hemolysin